MNKIVLATRNRHKIHELKTFLKDFNVEVLTLVEFPNVPDLVEDGLSFKENALKKASAVFRLTKLPALADDSGLEVFYLNGRPGVRSARYAGDNATDEVNNEKLLAEMRGVAPRRRKARFCAVLAIIGEKYEDVAEGFCLGRLVEEPRGANGFGYDPIFLPEGFERTYAELTFDEKNRISHRSRAFERLRETIRRRFG